MEVRLGKWEKGDMRRIYFNALALGNSKVYAYARKNGTFEIGQQVFTAGQDSMIDTAINEGCAMIEKLIGKKISYDTKFDDVWAAVK